MEYNVPVRWRIDHPWKPRKERILQANTDMPAGSKRQCLCPRDICLTKGRYIPYYEGGDFCDNSTLSHSVLIDRDYKLVFPIERLHRDYMSNRLPCGYFFLKTRSVGIQRVLWLSVWGSHEQKVTAEEHVWTLWYF